MLKGRGRDPRAGMPVTPAHLAARPPAQAHLTVRGLVHRAPLAKAEPDYEVVEFPSEQYVNAKLQPPPPPPPRPPTGHPADAGASCGLCGGGGARVRCAECGRRALCASCDDMYHRHPKRRHHQRQALPPSQLRDELPPLPPKVTPPVPPPRRHKLSGDRSSASPRPSGLEQRRATLGHMTLPSQHQPTNKSLNNHATVQHPIPAHLQRKLTQQPTAGHPNHLGMQSPVGHVGSMPYLNMPHAAPMAQSHAPAGTQGHLSAAWGQQRGSLTPFNMHQNVVNMVPSPAEAWESPDSMSPPGHASPWGRPLRRGASVLELGAGGVVCGGCAHCSAAAPAWRYGSCASLDHAWPGAWPHAPPHPPPCCQPQHPHNMHAHQHGHTPQPYRRVDSRAVSRAASRPCSRAASPAASVRSRASRRARHRTPSPPPLPSSDADSESDSDSPPHNRDERRISHSSRTDTKREPSLGPAPPPPAAAWHCEHCTYVNEPGVRVCAVCCRTPTAAPNFTANVNVNMARLRVADNDSPSPVPTAAGEPRAKQNGEATKQRPVRERASTGCGPSPPREETPRKPVNRLVTPTREPEQARTRHDMAVGPSPPRDHNMATGPSPPREPIPVRASPYRELQRSPPAPPTRHSVSVGPSPPRDTTLRPTVSMQIQKKSTGTSPPREAVRETPPSTRANVSNTGTSPPPQSISTQTYEAGGGVGAGPGVGWERAPSASRSRPRRRPRDPARRERSHSRHSLSSDTRVRALMYRDVTATSQESERSVRTSVGGGGSSGRWEWRETRDSSPGGEWSDGERRRLTRRASHLDLRRARQPAARRASFYGSEAASPEPLSSTRTLSLEALAGAGARREAERGLELARLMTDAERLGFSAAEVHAALAQNPTAPLSWLRERWPSLCAGVRAAAARLAPGVAVTELEARAALARHRGAMWPAVTECVERHRRQVEAVVVGEEGRLRGRVWGSPAGADDDAAPPARRTHRARAEDSSDEFEATTPNKLRDDDWMYLPLEPSVPNPYDIEPNPDVWSKPQSEIANGRDDIANKLKSFLIQAGVPSIDENLLLKGLLADSTVFNTGRESNDFNENYLHNKPQPNDLVQSEIDFIDAYNALTRLSPLPNIKNPLNLAQISKANGSLNLRQEERSLKDLHTLIYNREKHNEIASKNNFRSNQSQEQLNLKVPDLNKLEGRQQDNEPKEIESATDLHLEEHAVIVNRNVRDEQPKTRSRENTPKENIPNTTKRELVPHTVIANNRVSPEQSIKKPNTSSNPRNSTNVPENTPKTSHREDERTNNLSDIVDDTQRLIQQMKEEINSDINSLDGRSMSQSEPDNSSNDDLSTEHESSYSDSHEETDDISSDENETSGTEEDSKHSKKSGTVVNRTSSEDNEQFEEAMDHIEEQNENFKQTNIEILNSIARSLQEEHTISVRASQTEEPNATQIKETIQSNQSRPPAPKLSKTKVQDLNNNLFAVVNSFEEIYDEINSSSGNEYKNTDQQKTGKIESTERTSTLPQTPRVNIERRDIEILLFTPISPTKLIIDERELPVLNAIIENIEEPLEITEYDSLENHTSNIAENLEEPPNYLLKNNAINAKESDITLVTLNNDHQLDSYSDNIHGNSQYREFSGNEHNIEDNAHYDSHNVSLVKENGQSLETNNEAHRDINNIIDNRALTDKDNGFDHNEESNMNEQIYHIHEPNLNNSEEIYHIGAKETSKSPEKSISGSSNSGGKISAMAKSSIPKLIRILPNNKQKFDKTPKVIASKVPVRRGSIKQYPAPTPPKTHFGNIQSGLVKQLQTRLFNSKTTKVTANPSTTEEIKSTPSHSATVEVKASTSSTLNKKRPAPQPPSRLQEIKQPSPPQASPPKEKKNYFRETCRTEDEWTESDSEDSQLQIRKGDDEPQRVPSPPPPITLRRVSGQLIDLARVRLLEGSPERQARMLLAEGAAESWEQAQLAVELVSRGADPPAALLAALECADLNAALAYLYQDCELCASRFPEHEMVSMLRCTHRCCRECARHYFTVQVTERSIVDCVCPYCKEPELETLPEDAWLEYFAHLDILLKMLLEVDVHELFQRKLRDRTLARDPNFRWCVECSSGFFVHPKQKKLRCPECKSVSCATCRKPWSSNHEGLSCEQYAAWLEDNDPERSVAAVQQHLRENGLECPRCRFKYSLSRGGCMHFTCTQCKFEFCYGCGKPFMMGARCGLSEYCAKLGLHAHHPRNCLFYLRDKEPHELQTLLQMNDVSYETELAVESGAGGGGGRCPVQLQRETPAGLVDGACGSEVAPKHAGLCKNHYLEYLSRVVRARGVDPLPLLGVDDLETLVRRAALRLPPRPYGTLEGLYKRALTEIVKEKIPLD